MKRFICVVTGLVMAGALFAVGSSGGSAGSSGSGTSASASPSKTPTALDLYNAGSAAAKSAKYDEAIKDFSDAIALKSDYAEAYNMLGFCTRKQGNVAKAFTYYETALKLKPNFPEAREYYGEAFLQQGNLARAVQQYVILQKAGSKFASELLDEIDAFVNQKG
jgi:tetratricopeptide (TPR) repeat protein